MMDETLLQFCTTERQKEIIQAVINADGSCINASKDLDVDRRWVFNTVAKVKKRAEKQGWSPENDMYKTVPNSYKAKGVSTLYDQDGNVKVQWVKSQLTEEDKLEALKNALEDIVELSAGLAPKPQPKRRRISKDELACYLIGDAHLGMYAWHEETGQDFDCEIASRDLKYAFDRLVENAPDSDTCLIVNLGDFFHFDNHEKKTTKGGNVLDGDTRLERVFRIGVSIMNYFVLRALEKHNKVICRNVRGNHDDILSMALKYQMQAYWKKEKRVEIEMSPAPCWTYEFGKVALLITHGHAPKPNKLPEIFSGVYPELWGKTKHRYALHGHFHSKMSFSTPGCIVEGFTNLAPNDYWHVSEGYHSPQEMTMCVYHKDKGEIRRSIERPAIKDY